MPQKATEILQALIGTGQLTTQQETALTEQLDQSQALLNHVVAQENRLSVLEKYLSTNVINKDEDTQLLIAKTNEQLMLIKSHVNSKFLEQLLTSVLQKITEFCADFIPLASGKYMPHTPLNVHIEKLHEGLHLLEHILHFINGHNGIVHVIGNGLPFVSTGLKLIEIWNAHLQIHQAHDLVGHLRQFNDEQREVLHKYVIATTLLSIADQVDHQPMHHPQAVLNRAAGDSLTQWFTLLLTETISTLHASHDCKKLTDIAYDWSNSLTSKFQKQGTAMPIFDSKSQKMIFQAEELETALTIQTIFSGPIKNETMNYLNKPINDFIDDFHRKIYQNVLVPYDFRANSNTFWSLLCGYTSNQIQQLREFHARFLHALHVTHEKLSLLNNTDQKFRTQLHLINTCFYANLHKMGTELEWHQLARTLHFNSSSSSLPNIAEPLKVMTDGTITLVSAQSELVATHQALAEANIKADKATQEAANSAAEATAAKAAAAQSAADATASKAAAAQSAADATNAKAEAAQSAANLVISTQAAVRANESVDQMKKLIKDTMSTINKTNESKQTTAAISSQSTKQANKDKTDNKNQFGVFFKEPHKTKSERKLKQANTENNMSMH